MLKGGVKNFFAMFLKPRNCLQRFILQPPLRLVEVVEGVAKVGNIEVIVVVGYMIA